MGYSLLPDRRALNGLQVLTVVLLVLNLVLTGFCFTRVLTVLRDTDEQLRLLDTEIKAVMRATPPPR
jgi:hypothetical protein